MSLQLEGLSAGYGGTPVIAGATANAPAGGLTVLIGPNGSGKSTLLKAIAGLIPAGGEIRIDGAAARPEQRRESVAYMPQDTGASSSLTVLEVVLLGRLHSLGFSVPRQLARDAEEALAAFGLAALQGRTLETLSGGQRQLVFLVQSLFRRPRVLLLDEPTAALDLRHQLLVLSAVQAHTRRHGTITIAAMHDLSLGAQFADHMICLDRGAIPIAGAPQEVLTETLIEEVYGVEARLMTVPGGLISVVPIKASAESGAEPGAADADDRGSAS